MKELTREGRFGTVWLRCWRVGCISNQRVTRSRQVGADLMRAPGNRPSFYQKVIARRGRQYADLRAGLLSVCTNDTTPPVSGIALQWPIQQERRILIVREVQRPGELLPATICLIDCCNKRSARLRPVGRATPNDGQVDFHNRMRVELAYNVAAGSFCARQSHHAGGVFIQAMEQHRM